MRSDYLATKVPQFSWTRLAGADPFLGVEMASTGEMACFGKDLVEAYWTSVQSAMNFRVPEPGEGLLFGGELSKPWLSQVVDHLAPLNYKLYAADAEVKEYLETKPKHKVNVEIIEFPKEDKRALREVFAKYNIRGVFNLARARGKTVMDVDYVMRRNAVDFGVPLFMEPQVSCFTSHNIMSNPTNIYYRPPYSLLSAWLRSYLARRESLLRSADGPTSLAESLCKYRFSCYARLLTRI